MVQLLVIADDFTGALDTGIQLEKRGIPTIVTMNIDPDYNTYQKFRCLVIDTETRHAPVSDSYRIIFSIIKKAKRAGIRKFYKKVDSTMRGNIGAELEAALVASDYDKLVFIPSYPDLGRCLINGKVFIHGILLENTSFAIDPLNPIRSSDIQKILAQSTSVPSVCSDKTSLNKFLDNISTRTICTVDCENNEDMQDIAKLLFSYKDDMVYAGCAGFAQMLPMLLSDDNSNFKSNETRRYDQILIICGSVNQTSLNQIAAAEKDGLTSITLSPQQVLSLQFHGLDDLKLTSNAITILENQKALILKTTSNSDLTEMLTYAHDNNINDQYMYNLITDYIGRISSRIIVESEIGIVVIFGGDTIYSVLKHLHADNIIPEQEIFPGIVQFSIKYKERRILIVSKAGGFGNENLIRDILDYYSKELPDTTYRDRKDTKLIPVF